MKRGKNLIFFLIIYSLIILSTPPTSANFLSDFWGKITGEATSATTSLNITIGNSAPTIPFVQPISAQNPTESSTTKITFNFTAQDADGVSNLDDSTAQARFQRSGEPTRQNLSCVAGATSGIQKNYSCSIDMWYFDQAGSWTINVTIKDINNAQGENSSTTFTFNTLTAMVMSPTSLTWPTVGLNDVDVSSNNDPITINNTGNAESIRINVTGYDLRGETTITKYIFANNFTVSNLSDSGCSGRIMQNATSLNITSPITFRGNNSLNYKNATSGQQNTTYCLKGVPQDATAQSYSTAGSAAWIVAIVV